nr:unnamed protein product [Callosobruchus chinensis]
MDTVHYSTSLQEISSTNEPLEEGRVETLSFASKEKPFGSLENINKELIQLEKSYLASTKQPIVTQLQKAVRAIESVILERELESRDVEEVEDTLEKLQQALNDVTTKTTDSGIKKLEAKLESISLSSALKSELVEPLKAASSALTSIMSEDKPRIEHLDVLADIIDDLHGQGDPTLQVLRAKLEEIHKSVEANLMNLQSDVLKQLDAVLELLDDAVLNILTSRSSGKSLTNVDADVSCIKSAIEIIKDVSGSFVTYIHELEAEVVKAQETEVPVEKTKDESKIMPDIRKEVAVLEEKTTAAKQPVISELKQAIQAVEAVLMEANDVEKTESVLETMKEVLAEVNAKISGVEKLEVVVESIPFSPAVKTKISEPLKTVCSVLSSLVTEETPKLAIPHLDKLANIVKDLKNQKDSSMDVLIPKLEQIRKSTEIDSQKLSAENLKQLDSLLELLDDAIINIITCKSSGNKLRNIVADVSSISFALDKLKQSTSISFAEAVNDVCNIMGQLEAEDAKAQQIEVLVEKTRKQTELMPEIMDEVAKLGHTYAAIQQPVITELKKAIQAVETVLVETKDVEKTESILETVKEVLAEVNAKRSGAEKLEVIVEATSFSPEMKSKLSEPLKKVCSALSSIVTEERTTPTLPHLEKLANIIKDLQNLRDSSLEMLISNLEEIRMSIEFQSQTLSPESLTRLDSLLELLDDSVISLISSKASGSSFKNIEMDVSCIKETTKKLNIELPLAKLINDACDIMRQLEALDIIKQSINIVESTNRSLLSTDDIPELSVSADAISLLKESLSDVNNHLGKVEKIDIIEANQIHEAMECLENIIAGVMGVKTNLVPIEAVKAKIEETVPKIQALGDVNGIIYKSLQRSINCVNDILSQEPVKLMTESLEETKRLLNELSSHAKINETVAQIISVTQSTPSDTAVENIDQLEAALAELNISLQKLHSDETIAQRMQQKLNAERLDAITLNLKTSPWECTKLLDSIKSFASILAKCKEESIQITVTAEKLEAIKHTIAEVEKEPNIEQKALLITELNETVKAVQALFETEYDSSDTEQIDDVLELLNIAVESHVTHGGTAKVKGALEELDITLKSLTLPTASVEVLLQPVERSMAILFEAVQEKPPPDRFQLIKESLPMIVGEAKLLNELQSTVNLIESKVTEIKRDKPFVDDTLDSIRSIIVDTNIATDKKLEAVVKSLLEIASSFPVSPELEKTIEKLNAILHTTEKKTVKHKPMHLVEVAELPVLTAYPKITEELEKAQVAISGIVPDETISDAMQTVNATIEATVAKETDSNSKLERTELVLETLVDTPEQIKVRESLQKLVATLKETMDESPQAVEPKELRNAQQLRSLLSEMKHKQFEELVAAVEGFLIQAENISKNCNTNEFVGIDNVLEMIKLTVEAILHSTESRDKLNIAKERIEEFPFVRSNLNALEKLKMELSTPLTELSDIMSKLLSQIEKRGVLNLVDKSIGDLKVACESFKGHKPKKLLPEDLHFTIPLIEEDLRKADLDKISDDDSKFLESSSEPIATFCEYINTDSRRTEDVLHTLTQFVEANKTSSNNELVKHVNLVINKGLFCLKDIRKLEIEEANIRLQNIQLVSDSIQELAKSIAGIKYAEVDKEKILTLQKAMYPLQTAINDLNEHPLTECDFKFLENVSKIFDDIGSYVGSLVSYEKVAVPVEKEQIKIFLDILNKASRTVSEDSPIKIITPLLNDLVNFLPDVADQLEAAYSNEVKSQESKAAEATIVTLMSTTTNAQDMNEALVRQIQSYAASCENQFTDEEKKLVQTTVSTLKSADIKKFDLIEKEIGNIPSSSPVSVFIKKVVELLKMQPESIIEDKQIQEEAKPAEHKVIEETKPILESLKSLQSSVCEIEKRPLPVEKRVALVDLEKSIVALESTIQDSLVENINLTKEDQSAVSAANNTLDEINKFMQTAQEAKQEASEAMVESVKTAIENLRLAVVAVPGDSKIKQVMEPFEETVKNVINLMENIPAGIEGKTKALELLAAVKCTLDGWKIKLPKEKLAILAKVKDALPDLESTADEAELANDLDYKTFEIFNKSIAEIDACIQTLNKGPDATALRKPKQQLQELDNHLSNLSSDNSTVPLAEKARLWIENVISIFSTEKPQEKVICKPLQGLQTSLQILQESVSTIESKSDSRIQKAFGSELQRPITTMQFIAGTVLEEKKDKFSADDIHLLKMTDETVKEICKLTEQIYLKPVTQQLDQLQADLENVKTLLESINQESKVKDFLEPLNDIAKSIGKLLDRAALIKIEEATKIEQTCEDLTKSLQKFKQSIEKFSTSLSSPLQPVVFEGILKPVQAIQSFIEEHGKENISVDEIDTFEKVAESLVKVSENVDQHSCEGLDQLDENLEVALLEQERKAGVSGQGSSVIAENLELLKDGLDVLHLKEEQSVAEPSTLDDLTKCVSELTNFLIRFKHVTAGKMDLLSNLIPALEELQAKINSCKRLPVSPEERIILEEIQTHLSKIYYGKGNLTNIKNVSQTIDALQNKLISVCMKAVLTSSIEKDRSVIQNLLKPLESLSKAIIQMQNSLSRRIALQKNVDKISENCKTFEKRYKTCKQYQATLGAFLEPLQSIRKNLIGKEISQPSELLQSIIEDLSALKAATDRALGDIKEETDIQAPLKKLQLACSVALNTPPDNLDMLAVYEISDSLKKLADLLIDTDVTTSIQEILEQPVSELKEQIMSLQSKILDVSPTPSEGVLSILGLYGTLDSLTQSISEEKIDELKTDSEEASCLTAIETSLQKLKTVVVSTQISLQKPIITSVDKASLANARSAIKEVIERLEAEPKLTQIAKIQEPLKALIAQINSIEDNLEESKSMEIVTEAAKTVERLKHALHSLRDVEPKNLGDAKIFVTLEEPLQFLYETLENTSRIISTGTDEALMVSDTKALADQICLLDILATDMEGMVTALQSDNADQEESKSKVIEDLRQILLATKNVLNDTTGNVMLQYICEPNKHLAVSTEDILKSMTSVETAVTTEKVGKKVLAKNVEAVKEIIQPIEELKGQIVKLQELQASEPQQGFLAIMDLVEPLSELSSAISNLEDIAELTAHDLPSEELELCKTIEEPLHALTKVIVESRAYLSKPEELQLQLPALKRGMIAVKEHLQKIIQTMPQATYLQTLELPLQALSATIEKIEDILGEKPMDRELEKIAKVVAELKYEVQHCKTDVLPKPQQGEIFIADIEKPLAELEAAIETVEEVHKGSSKDLSDELQVLLPVKEWMLKLTAALVEGKEASQKQEAVELDKPKVKQAVLALKGEIQKVLSETPHVQSVQILTIPLQSLSAVISEIEDHKKKALEHFEDMVARKDLNAIKLIAEPIASLTSEIRELKANVQQLPAMLQGVLSVIEAISPLNEINACFKQIERSFDETVNDITPEQAKTIENVMEPLQGLIDVIVNVTTVANTPDKLQLQKPMVKNAVHAVKVQLEAIEQVVPQSELLRV